MGVVYLAEDLVLGRQVALKFLMPEMLGDGEARRRLDHEARAAAALLHANICPVHEIGESDGHAFIAMAYLEGQTLRERLTRGRLPIDDALTIALQVSDALSAAHAKGIIHRDLKPANVMLLMDGRAVLMDFGLARMAGESRLTRSGATLGTVAYMSPEAMRGEATDARTDVWALGVLIYEMVTGRLPFAADHDAAMVYAVMNTEPVPWGSTTTPLPAGLAGIVSRALAKNKGERYPSAAEVAADVAAIVRDVHALPAGVGRTTRPRTRRAVKAMAVGAVAIAAILGTWMLRRNIPVPEPEIRTLAVLPLVNLSGDASQEYFADGMTDELITGLAKVGALKVISRGSVMRFKGSRRPPRQIARDLGVEALVEGTVLKVGDRVRISAELVRAETEQSLWAEHFERDLKDVLALQGEVSQAIVDRVRVTLTPGQRQQMHVARTVNPEAFQEYLKGRYEWNKYTDAGFLRAEVHFRRAVEIDPASAPAWAGLADVHYGRSSIHLPPRDAIPMARAAANRALEIDSTLAAAHTSLGTVRMVYDLDWNGAEREFRRAIDLTPSDAMSHWWLGRMMICRSRFDEGLAEIRKARELDPLSPWIRATLGWSLYQSRRYAEAVSVLEPAAREDSSYYVYDVFLGLVREQQGDHGEAVRLLERAVRLDANNDDLAQLAHAYGTAGRRADARRVIGRLLERSRHDFVPAGNIGMAYCGLGDDPRALDWLERGYDDRSEFLVMLAVEPQFDPWRHHPRFKALERRLGLSR